MTAPVEPAPGRTFDEILADRLANGDQAPLTADEHDALYGFMWADFESRPAKRLIAGFPEIWAEITEAARTFDVRQDGSGYVVRGETGETGGKQALGLDSGLMWVARFVGTWIGEAYNEDAGWVLAARHCRLVHGVADAG
jgi:hypothetical protein